MDSFDFYKGVALFSPLLTATLTSTITYYFALKGKKFDILYQNKISECKAVVIKLVDYKVYCMGRIAYLQGNELAPHWEEGTGTLSHQTEISQAVALNTFYLSQNSVDNLNNLISAMSVLSNVEMDNNIGKEVDRIDKVYFTMIDRIENCGNVIKRDLQQS